MFLSGNNLKHGIHHYVKNKNINGKNVGGSWLVSQRLCSDHVIHIMVIDTTRTSNVYPVSDVSTVDASLDQDGYWYNVKSM